MTWLFDAIGIYIMGFVVVFFIGHDVQALAESCFDAALWPVRVILGAWDLVDELREGWPGWFGDRKLKSPQEKKP